MFVLNTLLSFSIAVYCCSFSSNLLVHPLINFSSSFFWFHFFSNQGFSNIFPYIFFLFNRFSAHNKKPSSINFFSWLFSLFLLLLPSPSRLVCGCVEFFSPHKQSNTSLLYCLNSMSHHCQASLSYSPLICKQNKRNSMCRKLFNLWFGNSASNSIHMCIKHAIWVIMNMCRKDLDYKGMCQLHYTICLYLVIYISGSSCVINTQHLSYTALKNILLQYLLWEFYLTGSGIADKEVVVESEIVMNKENNWEHYTTQISRQETDMSVDQDLVQGSRTTRISKRKKKEWIGLGMNQHSSLSLSSIHQLYFFPMSKKDPKTPPLMDSSNISPSTSLSFRAQTGLFTQDQIQCQIKILNNTEELPCLTGNQAATSSKTKSKLPSDENNNMFTPTPFQPTSSNSPLPSPLTSSDSTTQQAPPHMPMNPEIPPQSQSNELPSSLINTPSSN
ncbi:putative signal peptide protein [Puccinia sorghi]|uniref:Putative signal peptide protein n=1 Tax=Puccinia sorghi TaxID=27349 RepID=A0A0L6UIU5_9BASI|nr:putative signal peptide protein [Puccinia sorghi]